VNAPPVVDENVENREKNDQEARGPLGLEANSNHSTCHKTHDGHKRTRGSPFTTERKSNEKEDQEHAAS
jgi:hypothetical protein